MVKFEDQINLIVDSYKNKKLEKSENHKALAAILLMIVTKCGISQNTYHIGTNYTLRGIKQIHDLDVFMIKGSWKKLKKLKMGTLPSPDGKAPKYVVKVPSIGSIEFYLQTRDNAFPSSKFNHGSIKRKLMRDKFGHLCYTPDIYLKYSIAEHRESDKKDLQLFADYLKQPGAGKWYGMDDEESKKFAKRIERAIVREFEEDKKAKPKAKPKAKGKK